MQGQQNGQLRSRGLLLSLLLRKSGILERYFRGAKDDDFSAIYYL